MRQSRGLEISVASLSDVAALAALELECWSGLQPLSAAAITARLASFGPGQLALFERTDGNTEDADSSRVLVGSLWSVRVASLASLAGGGASH